MKKNQILSYVAMGSALLIILSVFLPYYSAYGTSMSLWKAENPGRVLLILFSILVVALYVFNIKTIFSYFTAGAGVFFSLFMAVSNNGLDNYAIAFYFIFLASIAIGVATYMYDEKQGAALLKLNK